MLATLVAYVMLGPIPTTILLEDKLTSLECESIREIHIQTELPMSIVLDDGEKVLVNPLATECIEYQEV